MKELTKEQKWYYKKIMKLGKNKNVIDMSYDELYLVLDRVKFCYFLSFLEIKKIKLKRLKNEK